MKVSVDVYTKDIDAALAAYKQAVECGATDIRMNSVHDWDSKEFESINLMFDADHSSDAIGALDTGPFVKDSSDLDD